MRRRRHRRLRRKEIKKRRTMIVISMFAMTFLFASGYAAFSTNITLTAKGNIKEKENVTIGGKKVYLAKTGDGLYNDPVEENRYIYRGANPDNYICLESGSGTCSTDNLYRIIAKEADGTLKIRKNTTINSYPWDPGFRTGYTAITNSSSTNGTRYSSNLNDYCYSSSDSGYFGCKSWGSRNSIYDSTGNIKVTTMPWIIDGEGKELPNYDSFLNVCLNGGKYLNINNQETTISGWLSSQNDVIKNNISLNHIFYIGLIAYNSNQTLYTDILQEKAYTWKGNIGLISITDYVRANSNTTNCGTVYMNQQNSNNYETCRTTNWMSGSGWQWTISSFSYMSSQNVWHLFGDGYINHKDSSDYSPGTMPTFFLKSTISLTGNGTNDANVYRVV